MEVITAVIMGVVGGLLMKALFHRESKSDILWAAVFGAVGGLGAYYLYSALEATVVEAVFALGIAVVVAGLLYEIWTRYVKTA